MHRALTWLRSLLAAVRPLAGHELALPAAALVVLLCAYVFIRLADAVGEGSTQKFDERVLRALRQPDDPAVPVGPRWLRDVALDVTALGSPAVLGMVVAAVAGLLLLQRAWALVCLTLLAPAGAGLLDLLLKDLIDRGRPTVVPPLREVSTPSFPSGHAMLSAVVYLTLGILLTHVVRGRAAKLYGLAWAMLLTVLVGLSRLYLGVHYPTDVLGGWAAGLAWALACWAVARFLRRG